jgi:hypothetical protein
MRIKTFDFQPLLPVDMLHFDQLINNVNKSPGSGRRRRRAAARQGACGNLLPGLRPIKSPGAAALPKKESRRSSLPGAKPDETAKNGGNAMFNGAYGRNPAAAAA